MFVGHLAVALGAKRASPRTPLAALIAAAFALDLIWPVFLLLGLERVRIAPGHTAFTPLAFEHYPWSHSLSMAIVWGVVLGRASVFVLKRSVAGLLIGAAVVSHWLLDYVTHAPDLPLWPGGPVVGFSIGAAALKSGAGAPQVIAYTTAWALYAIHRLLIWEMPMMPARIVWLRALVSLPLPFLAAALAVLLGRP